MTDQITVDLSDDKTEYINELIQHLRNKDIINEE